MMIGQAFIATGHALRCGGTDTYDDIFYRNGNDFLEAELMTVYIGAIITSIGGLIGYFIWNGSLAPSPLKEGKSYNNGVYLVQALFNLIYYYDDNLAVWLEYYNEAE